MATNAPPARAIFFTGVLAADERCLDAARERATALWGGIRLASETLPFTSTDYYREETGEAIRRAFFAFDGWFDPAELAARKLRANAAEAELAAELKTPYPRPVNLDPGYVTGAKVVLASCKNFAHRVYLREGVYAEVTLQYRRGGRFEALPWTFPDFASGEYDPFFLNLRRQFEKE